MVHFKGLKKQRASEEIRGGKSQAGLRHRIFWTLLAHTPAGAVAARCARPRTARRLAGRPAGPLETHTVLSSVLT
jgi:hypothetical protein